MDWALKKGRALPVCCAFDCVFWTGEQKELWVDGCSVNGKLKRSPQGVQGGGLSNHFSSRPCTNVELLGQDWVVHKPSAVDWGENVSGLSHLCLWILGNDPRCVVQSWCYILYDTLSVQIRSVTLDNKSVWETATLVSQTKLNKLDVCCRHSKCCECLWVIRGGPIRACMAYLPLCFQYWL